MRLSEVTVDLKSAAGRCLGTAAARPTVGRNVSAIMMHRGGDSLLFDCGEGTQRQMMRFGTGFSVEKTGARYSLAHSVASHIFIVVI